MSLRGLLIGAVLLCVLAGGVYWSERSTAEAEKKGSSETTKLVSIKNDEVVKVEVTRKDQPPAVVELDKDRRWHLTAPKPMRADSDGAPSLVAAFGELSQDKLVEEKAGDLGQFGLSAPAVQVAVTTKDGKKRTLAIGDEAPTGGVFFAKLDGDPRVFTILSSTKTSLDKSWSDLRDKRLLTFDESKLTRLELQAKGQLIEFGRNAQNEWQMVKPRPLRADNLQVEEIVRKLVEARMETVSDEEAVKLAAQFAGGTRVAVVNATDASGTQTLEVRKSGDNYLAKTTVAEGFHKTTKDLGDSLNKGIDDFRNKKLFDFGFIEPNKLEMRDGAKAYHFVKGGEKWWANGKQMDATSVQSLIDKLRDLTAIKFAAAGFTTPAVEITVTSNDGKRTEKVLVSQSGNSFFAKRDNEPSIYELDGKRVEEIQRAAADVKEPPPPPKK